MLTGVLDVRPERVEAVDQDTLNSQIQYTFVNGTPSSYLSYFLIDASSGKWWFMVLNDCLDICASFIPNSYNFESYNKQIAKGSGIEC